MWIALIVIGVIVVLLILWAVGVYNGLVKLRNLVQEAWRQIDVELKRRHDLIGNLVETVKGYAAHERGTLEDVMKARSAAMASGQSPAQQAASEGVLSQALGRLIAVAEAYPDLKANQNFLALLLQRQRARAQHPGRDRAEQHRGRHVQHRPGGVLRGRGCGARGRAGRLRAAGGDDPTTQWVCRWAGWRVCRGAGWRSARLHGHRQHGRCGARQRCRPERTSVELTGSPGGAGDGSGQRVPRRRSR
jgi:hypothetical protein